MKSKNKLLSARQVLKLWRTALLIRSGNKCEYPGCTCTSKLNGHHIIDKQIHRLKYTIGNGMMLCFYHHKMGLVSAHKDPFFKDKMVKAGVISKMRIKWLESIMQEELARMERKEKPPIPDLKARQTAAGVLNNYIQKYEKRI